MRIGFLIVISALFLGFYTNVYAQEIREDGPEIGDIAPDFTLECLDGTEVTLSEAADLGYVILIFGSCT